MMTDIIKIDSKVKKSLDELKLIPRDTYSDVIKRLLEEVGE